MSGFTALRSACMVTALAMTLTGCFEQPPSVPATTSTSTVTTTTTSTTPDSTTTTTPVEPTRPTFSPSTGAALASLTLDRPVDIQLLTESGEPGSNWQVIAGALPSGVTLSISGVLSGQPTELGYWSAELSVGASTQEQARRDAAPGTASGSLQLWGWVRSVAAAVEPAVIESHPSRTVRLSVGQAGGDVHPNGTIDQPDSVLPSIDFSEFAMFFPIAGTDAAYSRGRGFRRDYCTTWIASLRSSGFPTIASLTHSFEAGTCNVKVSADGTTLLYSDDDGPTRSTHRFVNLETGAVVRTISNISVGATELLALAADGSAAYFANGTGTWIRIGRSAHDDLMTTVSHPCSTHGIWPSAAGNTVILPCADESGPTLLAVDSTGANARTIARISPDEQVSAYAISPDGAAALLTVTDSGSGTQSLWEVATDGVGAPTLIVAPQPSQIIGWYRP